MKIIGLTGGIGSGKSTVTEYLIARGFHVLDADKISREIVLPGSEMLIKLTSAFGTDILLEDGSLDRKKLGDIVFSDPERRAVLDDLMHDEILEIILERVIRIQNEENSTPKNKVIFIDAPLLFETGLDNEVNEVWVINADEETRIKRIMERDCLKREDILKIISSQMSDSEKSKRANVILNNTGDREQLYQNIENLLSKI